MMHTFKNNILSVSGKFLSHPGRSQSIRTFVESNELIWGKIPKIKRRHEWPFQILLYHRVLPEFDPLTIDAITTEEFESHVRLLASCFRPISMDQLVEEIEQNELKSKTVCISFDDGYQDNYTWAFPILKKYQVPATIFLTSDFIGTRRLLWHDSVMYAVRHTRQARLSFPPAQLLNCDLNNPNSRFAGAMVLLEWFKKQNPELRQTYLEKLLQICQVTLPDERYMLDWDEIKEMANCAITFGAHTRSHTILALLDENALVDEICGCKQVIEQKLKRSIQVFAYPNGKPADFTRHSVEVLKNAGFRAAVTTSNGVNRRSSDLFALRRSLPWDRQSERFFARLLFERFLG